MTAFSDMLSADLAAVFFNPDDFATTVTYTQKGGVAKSVPMIIDYGTGDGGQGTDELNTDATAEVMASDIALVKEGDAILIGAKNWIVDFGKLMDDGLVWRVWMSRDTR